MFDISLEDRFWEKVDIAGPDDCWEWRASKRNGYGQINAISIGLSSTEGAHRISFYIKHGHFPKVVRHICDNPSCVNPAHLLGGTHQDNTDDMWARGRGNPQRGEASWFATMDEKQVREIRNKFSRGARACDIARQMGLGYEGVWKVCNRSTWKHIS